MSDIDAIQLKAIMKDAFSEVISANKELIYSIIYEAFEDLHFLEVIKEGEFSEVAGREEVFAILEAQ